MLLQFLIVSHAQYSNTQCYGSYSISFNTQFHTQRVCEHKTALKQKVPASVPPPNLSSPQPVLLSSLIMLALEIALRCSCLGHTLTRGGHLRVCESVLYNNLGQKKMWTFPFLSPALTLFSLPSICLFYSRGCAFIYKRTHTRTLNSVFTAWILNLSN